MSARSARPPMRHTAVAFLAGLLLGTALVAPVLPPLVAALPSPASFGRVGTVLVLGVLAIVVFVLGLVIIYFVLLLAEGS